MSLISLWIRVFSLVLVCVLGVVIIWICGRKISRVARWILSVAVIVIATVGIFDVSISIVHPQIKTFVGVYDDYSYEVQSTNFMQIECCFVVDEEKVYVDTDVISSRFLYADGFEPGCTYEIMVESNQNLIVSVKKMDE